jgi:hypothetical protein
MQEIINECEEIKIDIKNHTICFTGHRSQKLPWRFNEEDERCIRMKDKLKDIIEKAIKDGYDRFITGMALGFDMICAEIVLDTREIYLIGNGRYSVEISTSGIGSVTRIENFLASLEEKLQQNKTRNADFKKQLEAAKLEVDKPFEYADDIVRMTNELAELDAELDLNKSETPIVVDDDELQKEVGPIEQDEDDKDIDDEDEEKIKKKTDMEM